MLREVCFLIGRDDAVLWSDASTSPVALPDSRGRWDVIWRLRETIVEIVHTHPLGGAAFSSEDETTMAALNSALGRDLIYSIVTPTVMIRRTPRADEDPLEGIVEAEPWWTALIRAASGIQT
ncbi:MAG: Mov34/MPN/PAD-1 family protein [Myxococcota bacterium]